MKKYRWVIILLIASIFVLGACSVDQTASQNNNSSEPSETTSEPASNSEPITETLYMGGVPSSSAAYPLTATVAKILGENGIEVNIEASRGGTENLGFVQSDQVDIGIAGNHTVYQASKGIEEFSDVHDKITGWFPLYQLSLQMVVKKDSGIKTWEDLKGKKINVGVKGGSSETAFEKPFEVMGLSRSDFEPYFLENSEGLEALKIGTIDATLVVGPAPVAAVLEAQSGMDIRLIDIPKEKVELLKDDYPYYSPSMISSEIYGLENDTESLTWTTIFFVDKDLSEDLMYKMTKAVWENLDQLHDTSSDTKIIDAESLKNGVQNVVPIHPGALKYYQEQGLLE